MCGTVQPNQSTSGALSPIFCKMKDQIDRANELAEQEREHALAKLRQKSTACSRLFCKDCDEPIPELRRQTVQGCTRCVECQQIFEHQQKGYKK